MTTTFTASYPVRTPDQAIAIVRTEYSPTHVFDLTADGVLSIALRDDLEHLPEMLEATKDLPAYAVLNAEDRAALRRLLS